MLSGLVEPSRYGEVFDMRRWSARTGVQHVGGCQHEDVLNQQEEVLSMSTVPVEPLLRHGPAQPGHGEMWHGADRARQAGRHDMEELVDVSIDLLTTSTTVPDVGIEHGELAEGREPVTS